MPLLLPSLGSSLRCSSSSAHQHSDNRHTAGDVKGVLGFFRGGAHSTVPLSLFSSSSHGSATGKACVRHALTPSHHDVSGAGAVPVSDAASAPDAALDAEWDAVRLMTAATILSSSPSTASGSPTSLTSHDDDSSSLTGSTTASVNSSYDEHDLAPLAALDGVQALDADSLALAVGILRSHQPLDASEDSVQLSERLRDLLVLLRKRPASSSSHTAGAIAAAGAAGPSAAQAEAAAAGHSPEDDGFWSGQDEWADVRAALMGIGINASLDEEDEEDVWALEAGHVQTRRTRLLRSLPRLDSNTAQQLTAFLAELQQHTSTAGGPDSDPQRGSSDSNGSTAQAAAAGNVPTGHGAQVVSEEEEQWWQQAALAYSLLKQQAGKVKTQAERQQAATVVEADVLAVEQQ